MNFVLITRQTSFAKPACKWVQGIDTPEHIPELVYMALGKAASGKPGAVYLDFPAQISTGRVREGRWQIREGMPEINAPHPSPDSVARIAQPCWLTRSARW